MSFTRIDHVMIAVPELDRGVETYVRLGFSVQPGGDHPGIGTHNAIAFNEEDYLELIAIRDRDEYARTNRLSGLVELIERGGGLCYLIVQSDDLAGDVAAMRGRGVEVGEPAEGHRRTPSGRERRWRFALLGPRNPLPVFFIQHITPLAERRPAGAGHPNGVYRTIAWVKAKPDVRVIMAARDSVSNEGVAQFNPAAHSVVNSTGDILASGVEADAEGWMKLRIDLRSQDGQVFVGLGLLENRNGKHIFKAARQEVTFGGFEISPHSDLIEIPPVVR